MATESVEVVVIGAGVVGAAIAKALAKKYQVIILEKGPRPAEGITSRNSGVIHSGLYYKPKSLKADLCIKGQRLLYDYVERKSVPYIKTGKLVVATDQSEVEELEALLENAKNSGSENLQLLDAKEVLKKEGGIKTCGALWAPQTGIVDPAELTRSLISDAEGLGAMLLTQAQCVSGEYAGGGVLLQTNRGEIKASLVINAAGLDSDKMSETLNKNIPRIYPCRGDYFILKEKTFKHLIYPVKKKGSAGLGIHITLGIDGTVRLGPDAEYVKVKDDFGPMEEKLEKFRKAVENFLGPVPAKNLAYDQCGIRPKLRGPNDKEEMDFYISKASKHWVDLIGIESPGLTAALAIAEHVIKMI